MSPRAGLQKAAEASDIRGPLLTTLPLRASPSSFSDADQILVRQQLHEPRGSLLHGLEVVSLNGYPEAVIGFLESRIAADLRFGNLLVDLFEVGRHLALVRVEVEAPEVPSGTAELLFEALPLYPTAA